MPLWAALGRVAFVAVAAAAFLQLIGRAGGPLDQLWVRGLVKVGLWVVPAAALTWWLARRQGPAAWRALGLRPLAGRGVAVSLAATLPFGLAWAIDSRAVADADTLLGDVLLGPFAEEVLFRGFLFLGLRHLGWRFWSAGLVSALAFGAAHVPSLAFLESFSRTAQAAGAILLQIGAGGLLFAWVCERWRSLWPAIGLHTAINFWWVMVHGAEAAPAGPLWTITPWAVASALSVAAIILLTLRHTTLRHTTLRHTTHRHTTHRQIQSPIGHPQITHALQRPGGAGIVSAVKRGSISSRIAR